MFTMHGHKNLKIACFFFVIEGPCVPFERESEYVKIIYMNFPLQNPKPIFIHALTIPIKTRSSSGSHLMTNFMHSESGL